MNRITETLIEADPGLPVIRITRDFAASQGQLPRRDAILRSGMEVGVGEGYAKLDRMLVDGAV